MSSAPGPSTPDAHSAPPAGIIITLVLAGLSMLGPFTIDTIFPAFESIGTQFAADETMMQQVTSLYMLAFAVMSVFHGPLSDALGRRPVMIVGLIGYVLASIGCALAPNLAVLLLMRTLQGVFAGAATVVSRVVVRDMFSGPQAHQMMSRLIMIFSIAPAVAPVIGGWLLKVGQWPVIFWFIASYGLLAAVAVATLLPETHPPENRTPLRVGAVLGSLLRVGRNPTMLRLAFVTALVMGGQFIYIVSAPIIVNDLLGLGERDFWVLFVPVISGVCLGAWLSGRLAERVPRHRLIGAAICAALLAGAINIGLAGFVPQLPWAVLGAALLSVGTAVAFPAVQLEMLDAFPSERGAAASLGSFSMLGFNALLAGVIAPLVTGSLLIVAVTSTAFVAIGGAMWVVHVRQLRR